MITQDNRHEVTRILLELRSGDSNRVNELIPLVYDELRGLAAVHLARERPGQTLQPTALVHEAYLRLIHESVEDWESRRHFFASVAEAMRRILIENARRKQSRKRGGDFVRTEIDPDELHLGMPSSDLLDLNTALDDLGESDPESAELVKMHYFAGLTLEQIGDLLGFSTRTAKNRWAYAKAWLYRRLKEMR